MSDHLIATAAPSGGTAAGPPGPLANPTGYDLLDEVGRGGMGVVYRARDLALSRDVAVKVLADRYPPDSPAATRFLNEARITGQLQHPGIPAVHQVGSLPDGRPFLAMKLIKGRTLEAMLEGPHAPGGDRGRLVAVFEAVCQAVGYAHAHQVLHRDIKPANVMVGAFGEVQVMDWGLAKVLGEPTSAAADPSEAELTRAWTQVGPTPDSAAHTQAGSLVGTPAFIAPEQALGEIAKVDERSDVFGLGALLAVILTGKPPYVGASFESVRVQAVRGKLDDCFARLEASGAEPGLAALCRRCLAFEPGDRPANAGEVAKAVAELRAAADERARRAELDKVRVEGERATAEAQAAERRKRRRLWLGAAALLAVAVVGGLAAVVVVQRRANAELAAEQAKVQARNEELAAEQAKVQARFDTAVKAIETFHTGVSEDMLLKNPEFKDLRAKLLAGATRFYRELESLLAGQTDARSRKTLAAGYFQLGELMGKIGDNAEAVRMHRQALAIRRELAAEPGADVETRLDVARSLEKMGRQLFFAGDMEGALPAFEEQRDVAERLQALDPTDAVRYVRARGQHRIGAILSEMRKPAEALDAHSKALPILQKLVDASPADTDFQAELALIHMNTGNALTGVGKAAESLDAYSKALAIWQKLVDANPAGTEYQQRLVLGYHNISIQLLDTGRPAAALEANRKALNICQKLVHDQPAVTTFQSDLADVHNDIGVILVRMGKPTEALEAFRKALSIQQKLVDASPANTRYQLSISNHHTNIGVALGRLKRQADAFPAFEAGLAIRLKLVEADPKNAWFAESLGVNYAFRGAVRVRAGQPAEAAADLRRALDLWAKLPHLQQQHQVERLRTHALLAGLGADAKSSVTKEEAKAFADQSVAALAAVVKTGWALPSELREPDFDAVRGRADFQKLVAEVEAKATSAAAKDTEAGKK